MDFSGTSNGSNLNLMGSRTFGEPNHSFTGGLFASGTPGGNPTTGAFGAYNNNGHGLSVSHTTVPGFGTTLAESAHLNLLSNDTHNLKATAFHSNTELTNGFEFNKVGGGLEYNHAAGLGAAISGTHIPKIKQTSIGAIGKANLWTSPNSATSLDAVGGVNRAISGPFKGKTDYGVGIGLNHKF